MAMTPTMWIDTDRLDASGDELYNLDAVAYESVMVGLFSITPLHRASSGGGGEKMCTNQRPRPPER